MKGLCLFLIVLVFSCGFLSVFGVVQAQSKPLVPEFTVKLVDNSYDVSPTQTTDPYKGTITQLGYHVKKIDVELKIKNQQSQSKIIYNIRTKGHYEQGWKEWHTYPYMTMCPEMTNGQYTTLTYTSDSFDVPDGGRVDFQVEAWSGAFSFQADTMWGEVTGEGKGYYVFDGVSSGWSKTQTITIDKNSNGISTQTPDNSETPSTSNQPTDLTWIQLSSIIAIVAVISVTTIFLILRKTNITKNIQNDTSVLS
jgi:hypothetical protein